MKKVLFLSLALLLGIGATAQTQTESGKFFVRAGLSGLDFSYLTEDDGVINLDLAAGMGYFVANKLALRADVGLNYFKFGEDDGDTSFEFDLGLRYYIVSGLHVEALLGLGNTVVGYYGAAAYNDEGDKKFSLGIKGLVGYSIFLGDHAAIEPQLIFQQSFEDQAKLNIGLGASFTITF
jgi:hypothetical protein